MSEIIEGMIGLLIIILLFLVEIAIALGIFAAVIYIAVKIFKLAWTGVI